ncbi:hypothetical protein TWF694_005842 [Orbilia ellipsospora]|uniref:Uncharacterized protein n=1 Tax=Orbilia ellipsospora TaxID=2528407 RepID=A0AAV9WUL5_9PEZI
MQFFSKSIILALVGSLVSTTFAAPAPEPDAATSTHPVPTAATVKHKFETFKTDASRAKPKNLLKRTDTACWDTDTFETSDYWAMENSWWSHTDWIYLPAETCHAWTWGSMKICVNNAYLTQNTHVYLRDIGDAMAAVGNCCLTDLCSGGISSIHGDSGLLVDVYSIASWKSCT